ncbi:MAG: antitoxin [Chthoniobacterales bacterium]|nr:antitoxin [Chthoniobacterales bacterium]
MPLDLGKAASLRAVVLHDIAAVNRLQTRLEAVEANATDWQSYSGMAAAAYCLHNIYNALENSFEQISRTFENHVVDVAQWHKELLAKMFLDMSPVRPRVLPEEARKTLNDLRGFRDLFRHAYDFELDARRLASLREDWEANRERILDALRTFADGLTRENAD